MMSGLRRALLCLSLMCVTAAPFQPIHAQDAAAPAEGVADYWENFCHYVLIAQTELANVEIGRLLAADSAQVLVAVEASRHAKNADSILLRATRTEALAANATKLIAALETAKLSRAREAQRIQDDIKRLGTGERAYLNAINRLREAGQWIAPHVLAALQDENQKALHPAIMRGMVDVGRPIVYPMAKALKHLEPVTQGQVAQVLSEIGYPRALPYMLQVLEAETTDQHAREVIQAAYDRLADRQGIPLNVKSGDLFLLLGQNVYRTATLSPKAVPGYDKLTDKGIVWRYDAAAGLVAVPVSPMIFGDVLAMDAGREAMQIDPEMDQALSLWLMANFRRENRLPEGDTDPTYPPNKWHPPSFYAQLAGPLRAHDVLAQALQDLDPPLALDAIAALQAIAGTEALINRKGTIQPLLWALSYPDRRVRFNAAFALTNAKPKEPFQGIQRIVPVLAEAVRQTDQKYAVVLAEGAAQGELNAVMVDDLDYQIASGTSVEGVSDQISASAGADLVILRGDIVKLASTLNKASLDYKLAAVPMIAIVNPTQHIEANRRFKDMIDRKRLFIVAAPADADAKIDAKLVGPAIKQADAAYAGTLIEADEAEALALQSLALLREIALTGADTFRLADAQPAMESALNDPRESVAKSAGNVLSLMENEKAQQAIANGALDGTKSDDVRISLLGSLAESATYFGNHLEEIQLSKLLELTKTAQGDLAVAASRAHGGLALPTSNAVQLIVKD